MLIAALIFGAPVAASSHKPGTSLTIGEIVKNVAALVGIVGGGLIVNFALARLYYSKKRRAENESTSSSPK
jgi:hypothetical protein